MLCCYIALLAVWLGLGTKEHDEKITIWLKKPGFVKTPGSWVKMSQTKRGNCAGRRQTGRKGWNEVKKEQRGESPNLCEKCPSHFLNAFMKPSLKLWSLAWTLNFTVTYWAVLWFPVLMCKEERHTNSHSLTHFKCWGRILFFGWQCHKILHQNKGW